MREDNGILTLRYEETKPAKPPLAVTVPPPRQPPTDTHPALRSEEERKRDSGLAPTTSSKAREGSVNTVSTIEENALGPFGVKIDFNSSSSQIDKEREVPTTPSVKRTESVGERSMQRWMKAVSRKSSTRQMPTSKETEEESYSPITTPIPTDSLLDDGFLDTISFSKRGSIMFGGKKDANGHVRPHGGRRYVGRKGGYMILLILFRQPGLPMNTSPTIKLPLSDDLEKESQKVRSMYEQGSAFDWEDGKYSAMAKRSNFENEPAVEEELAT
jgi:hypothetical protein